MVVRFQSVSLIGVLLILAASLAIRGQESRPSGQPSPLSVQLRLMRAKAIQLESLLYVGEDKTSSSTASSSSHAAHHAKKGQAKEKGPPAGKGKSAAGSKMMGKAKETANVMGRIPRMKTMSMPSSVPGKPGVSQLYHIGETGFFLNYPRLIELSTEQLKTLNELKVKALLADSTSERQIAEAEQQLWVLTGSDKPDMSKIDKVIKEIEQLQGQRRLALIRAVGEAAKLLTEGQKKVLLGLAPSVDKESN